MTRGIFLSIDIISMIRFLRVDFNEVAQIATILRR